MSVCKPDNTTVERLKAERPASTAMHFWVAGVAERLSTGPPKFDEDEALLTDSSEWMIPVCTLENIH